MSSDGEQGNGASLSGSISGDGRFVAFRSHASNLVSGDTNGVSDIFLRDRNGATVRVSISSDGSQANGESDSASISADGRFVTFRSSASNLVAEDTNGVPDVFVRDLVAGTTIRVSVSGDGRASNGDSRNPQMSADGSRVVFSSIASSFVTGDTNRTWDVFVHDISTGSTERLSVSSDGVQGNGPSVFPTISGDGRVVAFVSDATTLVASDRNGLRDLFVHDLSGGTTTRASNGTGRDEANGRTLSASLSNDGRFLAFSSDASNLVAGDANRRRDIFVIDRGNGSVRLVSISSAGDPADRDSGGPSVSADGRFVAFQSFASNLRAGDDDRLLDVFVADLANRTTSRLSTA